MCNTDCYNLLSHTYDRSHSKSICVSKLTNSYGKASTKVPFLCTAHHFTTILLAMCGSSCGSVLICSPVSLVSHVHWSGLILIRPMGAHSADILTHTHTCIIYKEQSAFRILSISLLIHLLMSYCTSYTYCFVAVYPKYCGFNMNACTNTNNCIGFSLFWW